MTSSIAGKDKCEHLVVECLPEVVRRIASERKRLAWNLFDRSNSFSHQLPTATNEADQCGTAMPVMIDANDFKVFCNSCSPT